MPAPTSQAYTTGEAEKQAARNNADLPQLACPLCETKRRVEVVRHGDGALDKIKHLSGPIFVSMGRNKVQKCRCAACPHEWQLTPPPPTGGAAPAAPAAADDDEEAVKSPPKKQQRRGGPDADDADDADDDDEEAAREEAVGGAAAAR